MERSVFSGSNAATNAARQDCLQNKALDFVVYARNRIEQATPHHATPLHTTPLYSTCEDYPSKSSAAAEKNVSACT